MAENPLLNKKSYSETKGNNCSKELGQKDIQIEKQTSSILANQNSKDHIPTPNIPT